MLTAGTSVSTKSRALKTTDSREIQYLFDILQALKNEGGLLSSILVAVGGSPFGYNTLTSYNVTGGTQTLTANSVHSVSFSVISGTVTVSVDGGSTTITYPVGYNGNISASTLFDADIIFTASTGSDRVIVQTLS